jgi:hypothetical protein
MAWTNRKIHLRRNYEGIKCGNCLLSFCLLSLCLPVWAAVLYGSDTWSHITRTWAVVCENRVLKEWLTLSRRKWEKDIKNCIRRDYTICALHKVFFLSDLLKDDKMGMMQPTSSNNECVNSFVLNNSWEGTISETKEWMGQQSQNGSNTAWTVLNWPRTEYSRKVLWPHTHTHKHGSRS